MDAEPTRPHASRRGRAAGSRRTAALSAAFALVFAAPGSAHAVQPSAGPALLAKPAAEPPLIVKPAAPSLAAAPTHAWRDGVATRALTLEPGLRADFSPGLAGRPVVLRPAVGALKDVSSALQSPVLRDESGRLRALPGGVVVSFADAPGEADARARLARHGASAVQRLAPRAWLVEAPAGLASLELANRLAATGAFESAQPNWWVERALK